VSERILVVGPYPPARDGIGTYVVQQVRQLRRAGHDVEVLSPYPSAAHHHIDLVGPRHIPTFTRLMRRFDRVVVHFHPDVFYPHPTTPGQRISQGFALAAAFRAGPPVDLRLHEIDHRWGTADGPAARATRAVFKAAAQVSVHDQLQADLLVEHFGVRPDHVVVVDHGADFERRTPADRIQARRTFGIDADATVFVCIGFVAPHKGFDRAVHAFRRLGLGERGAQLHVVGSVSSDDPALLDHADQLRRLAADTPGVHLHLGYVGDELFDRWLVASDCVVLPYRRIWSSGVAERAALYDRPVIATDVGALAEQLGKLPLATVVADDAGLLQAMASVAGAPIDAVGSGDMVASAGELTGVGGTWPALDGDIQALQAEIRQRSDASRGFPLAADRRSSSARPATAPGGISPASPLRRLHPMVRPKAVSARPGVSLLKRFTHRLIDWELEPMVQQIDRLQRASAESVEATQAWVDERLARDDGPGGSAP
jgi:glycosyltransferase involved in cell wall biosynthesis